MGRKCNLLRLGLGYTGEGRRLSSNRKWPLRLKTYENGPESYDSRPFSIAQSGAQQQLVIDSDRVFRPDIALFDILTISLFS